MIEVELHEASDLFELDEELFKSKYSAIYSNFNSEEQNAYDLEESISDDDDIFNYSKRKNIASIKINQSETIEITNLDIYHWYQSNYIDSINVWTDQTFVYFSIDIALDQAGSLGIWSIELRDWVFTRRDECFCVKAAIYEICFIPKIPFKVVIDEYLIVTEMYYDIEQKSLVNGVLDSVFKNKSKYV